MADTDTAFVKQVFHVPKRQWETDIQHHRKADDLGARFEVSKKGIFGYSGTLFSAPPRLKPFSSDTARCFLRSCVMQLRCKNTIPFRGVCHGSSDTLKLCVEFGCFDDQSIEIICDNWIRDHKILHRAFHLRGQTSLLTELCGCTELAECGNLINDRTVMFDTESIGNLADCGQGT
ncbi:MAG: hypothetical protein QNJ03_07015 [Dinoroseobacter sp.]|nr:hypothetical protein [Dinoroseobacter sp.]